MSKESNTFYIESPVSVIVTYICPTTKARVSIEAKGDFEIEDVGHSHYYPINQIFLNVDCTSCGFSHEIRM